MGTFKFLSFDRQRSGHSFTMELESFDDACVCLRVAARFKPRELWQLYEISCQQPFLVAEVVDGRFIQRSF